MRTDNLDFGPDKPDPELDTLRSVSIECVEFVLECLTDLCQSRQSPSCCTSHEGSLPLARNAQTQKMTISRESILDSWVLYTCSLAEFNHSRGPVIPLSEAEQAAGSQSTGHSYSAKTGAQWC